MRAWVAAEVPPTTGRARPWSRLVATRPRALFLHYFFRSNLLRLVPALLQLFLTTLEVLAVLVLL